MNSIVLIGAVLIVLIVIVCLQKKEGYGGVLGELAPYQAQLSECVRECNRSDPLNRLLSQNNLYCEMYCDDVISTFARRGVDPKDIPISNNYTKCRKECNLPGATHNEKRKCESVCYGRNEVAQWCKETQCPYSLFDDDECNKSCQEVMGVNNVSGAWAWEMSRS